MKKRPTPETDADNDTQCELAAWELLREARRERAELIEHLESEKITRNALIEKLGRAIGERDALRDAVNALHDYVHGKRNDDKDISEILNGAMKI